MKQPQTYVSIPTTVQALQWTGDNLAAVQAFVAPASPLRKPDNPSHLQIAVFDATATATYPSLGRQYKTVSVPTGVWIIKRGEYEDIEVLTAADFEALYKVAGPRLDEYLATQEQQELRERRMRDAYQSAIRDEDASQVADAVIANAEAAIERQPETDAAGDVVDRETLGDA